jgi:NAD(P)-dependent dehydrogenase (short-subunit alcohol dehydrogenase family)
MTVAPPAPGVDGSGARLAVPLAEVVLRHQQLMASFLEQQKQVMLAYLGNRQAAEPVQLASATQPAAARTQTLPTLVRAPEPAAEALPTISAQPLQKAVESTPAMASAPPIEDLLQRLVALVAERTGYPTEMLAPEQDMEADLGIDSIKRVEILTSFARQFPDLGAGVPEQLRAARTLQDVVKVMRENLTPGPATAPPELHTPSKRAGQSVPEASEVADGGGLERYTLGMKEWPLPDGGALPIPTGALVITDDGRGYAASLRERLQSLGGRPVIVRLEGPEAASEGVYAADLADPAQVDALLQRIRRDHGRIGAVVHLLPLRPVPPLQELGADAFGRLLKQEVKGLFYLLHFAAADLRSVPGSWALTCLSFGVPPSDGVLPVPDHPWRGGLIGVIKTATVEWPEVVAKSLVLENPAVDVALRRILAELAGPRQEREAYYRDGSRLVPEPRSALLRTERTVVELGPEDVIVLIGGARGITAEVAQEMARQARPTLILVGRSPWPEGEANHWEN